MKDTVLRPDRFRTVLSMHKRHDGKSRPGRAARRRSVECDFDGDCSKAACKSKRDFKVANRLGLLSAIALSSKTETSSFPQVGPSIATRNVIALS